MSDSHTVIADIASMKTEILNSKEQRKEILDKLDQVIDRVEHLNEVIWEQKALRGTLNIISSNVEGLHTRVTNTETEIIRQKTAHKTNMFWVHGIWGSICAICGIIVPFILARLFSKP